MAMQLILLALQLLWASASASQGNISFTHRDLFPESFDWDEKHGFFILGSMTGASLHRLSDSGALEIFADEREWCKKCGFIGVRVDPPRNRVVAVIHNFDSSAASTPQNAVAAYDLSSSKRLFLTELHGDKSPVANDVAVDREGNLYVTNSGENAIWKISSDGEQASILTQDPVFLAQPVRSDDEMVRVCGLNGLAYHSDRYLLVTQSNSGAMFKINLEGTPSVVEIKGGPLVAADGVAIRGDGAVAVVSQSKAWLLRSSDHWRSASVSDELSLDPSGFATALKFRDAMKMYVLNGHLLELKEGKSRSEFSLEHREFPREEDEPLWMIVVLVLAVLLVLGWRFQMAHFFNEYKKKRL